MTSRNKMIVWIGLPVGAVLAGLSFPGQQVGWMFLGAIAVITVVAMTFRERCRREGRKAGFLWVAAFIGSYGLAGEIFLPKEDQGSAWDAATTAWAGQLIATAALSVVATVLVISFWERWKDRANKPPEATPGERLPSPPSPSAGAPQL